MRTTESAALGIGLSRGILACAGFAILILQYHPDLLDIFPIFVGQEFDSSIVP